VKVTLESTTKIVELTTTDGVVPARIWEGQTESGVRVHAYVTRIAHATGDDASQFERELRKCRAPSLEVAALPLRLVL
jgi:hypothetical protein